MHVLPTIQPNNSAVAFLIVVVCLGVAAIIIILSRYFNLWQKKYLVRLRFSPKKFKELSEAAEFTQDERIFLQDYFRSTQIPRSLEIFYDYRFGQNIMRQIYRATYIQPENFLCDVELARFYIFSVAQKLENFLHKNIFPKNTHKIPEGSRFYLDVLDKDQTQKDRFVGKLISHHRAYFEVKLLNGHPSSLPRGNEVKIELVKDGDRAIYPSRVRGYISDRKRKKLLVMDHGKKPEIILGARRYNRKKLQTAASVVPLRTDGNSFRVNGDSINALLCDISMTGCGVLSHIKFPKNSFISVSYLNPYDNQTIEFICKIMGYAQLRNTEIDAVILQTCIEKIDHHDRNLISAFVYDFENENDKIKNLQEQGNLNLSTFDSNTAALLRGRS